MRDFHSLWKSARHLSASNVNSFLSLRLHRANQKWNKTYQRRIQKHISETFLFILQWREEETYGTSLMMLHIILLSYLLSFVSHLKDAFVKCTLPCVRFEWKTAKSVAWSEWVHQTELVVFICLFSLSFLPSVSSRCFLLFSQCIWSVSEEKATWQHCLHKLIPCHFILRCKTCMQRAARWFVICFSLSLKMRIVWLNLIWIVLLIWFISVLPLEM